MSPARTLAMALALTLGTTTTLAGCTGSDERPSQPATHHVARLPAGHRQPSRLSGLQRSRRADLRGGRHPVRHRPRCGTVGRLSVVARQPTRPGGGAPARQRVPDGARRSWHSARARPTAIISFVARADGETTIELRYVGADGQPDSEGRTAAFTVVVNAEGQPPPPETTGTTTEAP